MGCRVGHDIATKQRLSITKGGISSCLTNAFTLPILEKHRDKVKRAPPSESSHLGRKSLNMEHGSSVVNCVELGGRVRLKRAVSQGLGEGRWEGTLGSDNVLSDDGTASNSYGV